MAEAEEPTQEAVRAADVRAGDTILTAYGPAVVASVEHVAGAAELVFVDDADPFPAMPPMTQAADQPLVRLQPAFAFEPRDVPGIER